MSERTAAALIDLFACVVLTFGGFAAGAAVLLPLIANGLPLAPEPVGKWAIAVAVVGYFAVSWATLEATPGQRLIGLRVTRQDGEPLGARWAIVRALSLAGPVGLWLVVSGTELGRYVELASIGWLGYVVVSAWNWPPALHDRLARSIVVTGAQPRRSVPKLPERALLALVGWLAISLVAGPVLGTALEFEIPEGDPLRLIVTAGIVSFIADFAFLTLYAVYRGT